VTRIAEPPVRRRHVLYVPGYDPMPPRRYRELYRVEGRKQAEISGYGITIKGSTGHGVRYRWSVRGVMDGAVTDTDIEFLLWNDIVHSSMRQTIIRTYWLLLKTLWLYVASGTLAALFRLRKAPILVAMYPAVILIGQFSFAVASGVLLFRSLEFAGTWGAALAGGGLVAAMLVLFRRFDRRFYAYYLLHDYAFWAQARGAMPARLRERVDMFADRIEAALDSDADEVLVVGHSSGAHLAVNLVAEVLRRRPHAPKLAFLTLGQTIPVVSFLPGAGDLRRDLRQVSLRPDVFWLDITAPGDGACFALSDPVAVSGVAPPVGTQFGPKVLSAAFSKTMTPEHQRRTRWRFLRRHVQYLCAFDFPLEYDYFRITAGPQSLRARFQARGSSASTRYTALSRFTDTGAADG